MADHNADSPHMMARNEWIAGILPSAGFQAARDALYAFARRLPLSDGILLECHGPDPGQRGAVDVSLRLDARDGTAARFASTLRSDAPGIAADPVWARLLEQMLRPDVGTLWLEFDASQIAASVPIPGVFWHPLTGADLAVQITAFSGGQVPGPAAIAAQVTRQRWPDFLGLMLSRTTTAVRVCHRLVVDEMPGFALPLTGADWQRVKARAGDHPVMLSFDLGAGMGPRIGVEIALSASDAPAGWVGQSDDLARVLGAATPSPLPGTEQPVWVRRANHQKLVFDWPGPPVSKTYLYLGMGWPG